MTTDIRCIQLSGLEEDLNQERDCLTHAKKEKDSLRTEVANLRQSQGFANRCGRHTREYVAVPVEGEQADLWMISFRAYRVSQMGPSREMAVGRAVSHRGRTFLKTPARQRRTVWSHISNTNDH